VAIAVYTPLCPIVERISVSFAELYVRSAFVSFFVESVCCSLGSGRQKFICVREDASRGCVVGCLFLREC
jgi:hypothetical protein